MSWDREAHNKQSLHSASSIRNKLKIYVLPVLACSLLFACIFVNQSKTTAETFLEQPVVIGPGSSLQLQTSQGPMTLTVDSTMDQSGYVHAYGFKNGVEYAGFVKLSSGIPPSSTGIQGLNFQSNGAQVSPNSNVISLNIAPDGSATLNGESVIAANSRTASILRLLAKKSDPDDQLASGPADPVESVLANEITQTKSLLSRLEEAKRARMGRHDSAEIVSLAGSDHRLRRRRNEESQRAMYAAMQTLIKSVGRIEQKEEKMSKVVDKVKKIMRYKPF